MHVAPSHGSRHFPPPALEFPANLYRAAMCYNLGLHQPCLQGVSKCVKGHDIDLFGHHFINLGCGTGIDGRHTGLFVRHNSIARTFANFLHEAGVPKPKMEPGGLPGLDVNRRGDILAHDFPDPGVHTVLHTCYSLIAFICKSSAARAC